MAQVRDAVLNVARYDIEACAKRLLAGDVGRLTRTLDGLMQEGEAPPLVLGDERGNPRPLTVIRAGLDAGRPVDSCLGCQGLGTARHRRQEIAAAPGTRHDAGGGIAARRAH